MGRAGGNGRHGHKRLADPPLADRFAGDGADGLATGTGRDHVRACGMAI